MSLFSISALVFIGGGMFVSVAVFGMGFYMLQRLIGLIVVAMDRRKWINALGGSTATTVRIVGLVLFSAELVSTFLGARWVFYTFVV